jgi:DNA-binding response OmpR family regulator
MYRVLVVDDEIAVCDLLKDFLTLKGYEVYRVHRCCRCA